MNGWDEARAAFITNPNAGKYLAMYSDPDLWMFTKKEWGRLGEILAVSLEVLDE